MCDHDYKKKRVILPLIGLCRAEVCGKCGALNPDRDPEPVAGGLASDTNKALLYFLLLTLAALGVALLWV